MLLDIEFIVMRSKATSFDIAYKAGVSQSTVSRALSGSHLVSEETRQKIQAIAKELNYKVDKNASNLRTQSSNTLALLLFEDPTSDDSNINPFFLSMLGSITRASANAGYDLLVSFQQLSDDFHADFEETHKADGMILLGYGDYQIYEKMLNNLVEQNTHFVMWGADTHGAETTTISCDNIKGGYDITQHLLQLGRKNLAFIGRASSSSPEFYDRYKGHCQALKAANIKPSKRNQIDSEFTEESGYQAALKLLEKNPEVDGIFAACDLIAIGVIKALKEKGIAIPQDISVAGYDNISIARFTTPPLTTVQQDTNVAGALLVETLVDLIKGNEVENKVMAPQVVIRNSCQ